jgi:glyoxylase I family protein
MIDIHHVSLLTSDLQQSLAFYEGILGLEQDRRRANLKYPGAWLQLGGRQIHLLELPNPDPIKGRPEHVGRDRHLALTVSDIAQLENALLAAGVELTRSRSGRRALFCRDPDGNGLEFVEITPSKIET